VLCSIYVIDNSVQGHKFGAERGLKHGDTDSGIETNVSRYLTQFIGLCSEVMEEYAVRHDSRVVRRDREGRVVHRRFRKSA
jgi:hypothetical protein